MKKLRKKYLIEKKEKIQVNKTELLWVILKIFFIIQRRKRGCGNYRN